MGASRASRARSRAAVTTRLAPSSAAPAAPSIDAVGFGNAIVIAALRVRVVRPWNGTARVARDLPLHPTDQGHVVEGEDRRGEHGHVDVTRELSTRTRRLDDAGARRVVLVGGLEDVRHPLHDRAASAAREAARDRTLQVVVERGMEKPVACRRNGAPRSPPRRARPRRSRESSRPRSRHAEMRARHLEDPLLGLFLALFSRGYELVH